MPQQRVQFDQTTYERFRDLILERSGLHFPEKRRPDLERGLERALAQSDCPSLESYYQILSRNGTAGQAWEQLICQLTVGETYFFRDDGQFQALQQHILPEIIEHKRSQSRHLRIWSAGCATGEEPYSIAMLLQGLIPDLADWSITILATDINRESLARARSGMYGDWSFRNEGWQRLRKVYFKKEGKVWHLNRHVRDMVYFAYLNLVEDPYPSLLNNTVAFDLILCRNVTIYFTPEITQRVVNQFYEALVEGGWLVVGHSEPSLTTYTRFETRNYPGAVFYRKADQSTPIDLSWLDQLSPPTPAFSFPSFPSPPSGVREDAKPDSALPFSESQPLETLSREGEGERAKTIEKLPTPSDLYAEATTLLESVEEEQRASFSALGDLEELFETGAHRPARHPEGRKDSHRGDVASSKRCVAPARHVVSEAEGWHSTTAESRSLFGWKPQDPALTAADLCKEAEKLLEQGEINQALERIQQALERDRDCARAYYLLAKARADAGQWEEAQHWCEQALDRDILLVEAHFLAGLIHSQEEELHQALAAMKRVVYLDRSAVLGHFGLANLYRELGDPERARKSLENTAQLLEALPAEALIPWSDGMTAGRLLYVVQQQMNGACPKAEKRKEMES